MNDDRFHKAFLLVLVVAISAAFVFTLGSFLMPILVAAIFAGLVHPVYVRIVPIVRGNRPAASALTLLLTLALVILPLIGILGVVVNQAVNLTATVRPVVERFIKEPTYLDQQLQRMPGYDRIAPHRELILTRAGDAVNAIGTYLVGSLSNTTRYTVAFVFNFFLVLYTMFFLLMDGPALLRAILNHLPLRDQEKEQVTERFLAVTRATVKGTIVIGIVQGVMSGLAFWAVGIPDAMFWTVVMAVLSILPVIGGALVWVPACIILVATGQVMKAILLAAFCSLIVGSVDNVLRPRLVGRDTRMHDLIVLFSTLGGIVTFGPIGFIIGPILAGLFLTSWHIFGVAFRNALRDGSPRIIAVGPPPPDEPLEPSDVSLEEK